MTKEKITHRVPLDTYEGDREPYVPREQWGPGPWDDEPDRVEWAAISGFPALITRSPLTGTLCGYVAVLPGHPLHGKGREDEAVSELRTHGGITYAAGCSGHICHVPEPGEPDNVWWFGFDTGHAFDRMPAMEAKYRDIPGLEMTSSVYGDEWQYRDLAYVRASCEVLAMQLSEAAK